MIATADIAIVGAGIAGASLAAEAAPHASLLLIEAEDQPGFHSTGRSAAFWSETYGGPMIQPLTTASRDFLASPPAQFSDRPFVSARGAVHITNAGPAAIEALAESFARSSVGMEQLGHDDILQLVPGLRPDWKWGLFEPSCMDIDVASLHAAYLRAARRGGARLVTGARVTRLDHKSGGWRIGTSAGDFEAGTVVNAAGAWAEQLAGMAGATRPGVQPFRRTISQLRVAPPPAPTLPLVLDAGGGFYFKPEAGGRLWLSPHDETPCPAGDCGPEEFDVALAIDRLGRVIDWRVERVEHSWAGLRSFAPDRLPLYGFDPLAEGFFWCAGQGGFGIQTAPAAAKLAAALLLGRSPDPAVAAIDPAPYLAGRFMN
jgi:D-arginine dehydrogenase